jgi:hypothetical protein
MYLKVGWDSRLGERAIDWGKLFQTDIVLGKKENL